jgi:hypothetical protein
MRRRDIMGLIGAAVLLVGCSKSHSWNQKLTVTVNTPEGEKSGSAVTRVSKYVGRGFATDSVESSGLSGEATIVDLGGGKYLFALLSNTGLSNTVHLVEYTWGDSIKRDPKLEGLDQVNARYEAFSQIREQRPLPRKNYPLLVTFTDINDPKSAREVKPDKLSAAFGGGYSLKSIKLEITEDAVTEGEVQKILPWIGDSKVMENPGWKTLPLYSREAIGGLLTDFKKAQNR